MTEDEQIVLTLRGLISTMPETDQAKVRECYTKIKDLMIQYGDHGSAAVALLGAELAAKA